MGYYGKYFEVLKQVREKGKRDCKTLEKTFHEKQLRELAVFSLEVKKWLRGDFGALSVTIREEIVARRL